MEPDTQVSFWREEMDALVHSFPPISAEICFEACCKDLTSDDLIQRCATSHDTQAWYEFIRRFHPLIAGVIARTAMRWTTASADLVDDLVQETYLKLCTEECRQLRQFTSRHENALYGFLKTVAYNVTVDYFKSRWAAKRGGRQFQDSDLDSAQATSQDGSLEDHILLQQLEDFIDKITDSRRDKLVFRLYYRQGFTSAAIAAIPAIGLSEKGVVSCIHRLTELLRKYVWKTGTLKASSLVGYEMPVGEPV
jgi:RNA polymerase sigma-70 factor (ECF subfamily)